MTAIEIMQRADALGKRVKASATVEEAKPYIEELRKLHDGQCLRCYCSADDPHHHPRRRLVGWPAPPACAYLPRLADSASND